MKYELQAMVEVCKLERFSAFHNDIWLGCEAHVTKSEVIASLNELSFEPFPHHTGKHEPNRLWHIRRIAYLVERGWSDPIKINAIVPPNMSIIADGNHRLCAAIIRGDEFIVCEICRLSLEFITNL